MIYLADKYELSKYITSTIWKKHTKIYVVPHIALVLWRFGEVKFHYIKWRIRRHSLTFFDI